MKSPKQKKKVVKAYAVVRNGIILRYLDRYHISDKKGAENVVNFYRRHHGGGAKSIPVVITYSL